jgi:hypothetical protein
MTVSTTYLNDAALRVLEMLEQVGATFDPPVKLAVLGADSRLNLPCWWIYPGDFSGISSSHQREEETYEIMIRLIIGHAHEGMDTDTSTLMQRLFLWIPSTKHYFNAHPDLKHRAGQSSIQYLQGAKTAMRQSTQFGAFTAQDHLGVEFTLSLTFRVLSAKVVLE